MENEKPTEEKTETKWISRENIIKGEILSGFGLVLLIATMWDFLSVKFDIPLIPGIERSYQLIGQFVVSIMLFMAPNDIVQKCKDLLIGFKK